MYLCGLGVVTGTLGSGASNATLGTGGRDWNAGGRGGKSGGHCGGISAGISVGRILGMIALGSNREGCGMIGGGTCWLVCGGLEGVRLLSLVVSDVVMEKMSESWRSARICSLPNVWKGAAGAGLRRASARIRAASEALSAEELLGMSMSCGKNSTVREIRSALVCVMYTVWHR